MTQEARVPVFGNLDDIYISRGMRHPFSGRARSRRIPWWEIRGKGPEGKRCKHCAFITTSGGTAKTYYKCMTVKLTRGPKTDIGANDWACAKFEPRQEIK